jgi:hypothetical protein
MDSFKRGLKLSTVVETLRCSKVVEKAAARPQVAQVAAVGVDEKG